MNCLRRCFLGVFIVGSIVIVAVAGILAFASSWLPDSDVAAPVEAIVVLAGDHRRTLYAADLYHQGISSRVLVSRPMRGVRERVLDDVGIHIPGAEEYDRMILLRKKIPADAIDIFGSGSISTYEEGRVLGQHYAGRSPSLLAVTSPYHVRRARMILTNALPGARIRVVATPYEAFPERWWASQDAARDLLLELTKIVFYAVGGRYLAPAE